MKNKIKYIYFLIIIFTYIISTDITLAIDRPQLPDAATIPAPGQSQTTLPNAGVGTANENATTGSPTTTAQTANAVETGGNAVNDVFGFLQNPILGVVNFIRSWLVNILERIVLPLIYSVMSYQNFFSNGVTIGWEVTRNFANLFFALILLIIAIATVLPIDSLSNYTAKRMLPNFIFVALFINFSKAIVGFLIDISQIIMISFYNSFGPSLSQSINTSSDFAQSVSESSLAPEIIALFSVVLVLVLIGVLLWTALILAMRVVTLWVIIMISPLAFMSILIPGLKSISDDWSKQLKEALITGPTLMFLLYLAVAVMNGGVGPDINGNLLDNGNILNYVLVIALLFLANATATKAGQAAPPLLQKAVGIGTTVATFGLGAYVGAGGYGTKQFADTSVGGITRGLQVVTGGKIKANSRYEAIKKDMKAKNDAGKGLFGGVGQQFSKEGREEQQKDYELTQAREYARSGNIDDPSKKRYKKVLLANMAEVASEIKDATNSQELGKQYAKALEDGELEAAAAIAAKISTLENGWNEAMSVDTKIFNVARGKEAPQEQMRYIFEESFGILNQNSSVIKELKSRMTNNLKDKGQGAFADGLVTVPEGGNTPDSSKKAIEGGLSGVTNAYAKNKGIFNRRKRTGIDPNTGEIVYELDSNNRPVYEMDPTKVYDMVERETNIRNLEDYKAWNTFGNQKVELKSILTDIKNGVYNREIPTPNISKIDSALKGLGASASSRVTGGTI
jgi:hypothetical protein